MLRLLRKLHDDMVLREGKKVKMMQKSSGFDVPTILESVLCKYF